MKLQFGGRLAAARDMPRFSIHATPGFAVSAVTVFATLLMGMLDAFTFITQDHTFVTAQTGNLIMLTVKGLDGDYISATSHIIVFAGYFLGAFLGQWISDRITGNERHRLRVFLLIQTLFFIAVAATHHRLPGDILLFMLGLLAGYEIDLFRKMGAITINNGIMTGNAKNLATEPLSVPGAEKQNSRPHGRAAGSDHWCLCAGHRGRYLAHPTFTDLGHVVFLADLGGATAVYLSALAGRGKSGVGL